MVLRNRKYFFLPLLLVLALAGCQRKAKSHEIAAQNDKTAARYLFFLHNRFLEDYALEDAHPEYGKVEYTAILQAFRQAGFTVFSEKRVAKTDVKLYARKIVAQIDSLLKTGVSLDHISVVGTSKGGYIAQYVSTFLANPEMNYVFIGCYQDVDLQELPDIQFCGNILTIYDKSDFYGVSAKAKKEASPLKVPHFKEIELDTRLKHGFLYQALDAWLMPAIKWSKQGYE